LSNNIPPAKPTYCSSKKSQVAAARQLQKLNCIIQHETALNRAVTTTSWRQQLLSGISRPVTTKLQQLPKCNKYPAETTNQLLQLDSGNKQQRSSCNNYPVITSNEKKPVVTMCAAQKN
jgi:hypothetical protein